jgi:hypothetical protein
VLHFGAIPIALVETDLLSGSRPHGPARVPGDAPVAPPPTCSRSVHSRDDGPSSLRPRGFHPRSPVPPLWFRTTSAASSASGVAGLLHPAAGPGVRRVSASSPPIRRSVMGRGFPAAQVRAPRRTPRRQPFRVTAAVAPLPFARITASLPAVPLPVPRSSGWEDREGRLRGLAPSSGLVCSLTIAGRGDPLLPGLGSSSRSFHTTGDPSPTVSVRGSPIPGGTGVSRASSASHPARRPEPSGGAPPITEVTGVRTAPEGPVPGPTPADDPRTAAEVACASRRGRSHAGEARLDRGAQPKLDPGTRSGRNPFEGSPRALYTRRPPNLLGGAEGAPSWPAEANREGDLDAVEVCPEPKSRGAGPPQVALLRSGDPRRPS